MNATILNISDAGNGNLAVMASFVDDNGNPLNYNNVTWNSQPAIQFIFPIPISSPTFTDDMVATVSNNVQNRLYNEFNNWIANNVTTQAISYLTSSLVGQVFTQTTATVGNAVLAVSGSAGNAAASISAIPIQATLGNVAASTGS